MNQQSLIDKINQAANLINSTARTGKSNYILTSSYFYEIFKENEERELKYKKRKSIIDKLLKSGS